MTEDAQPDAPEPQVASQGGAREATAADAFPAGAGPARGRRVSIVRTNGQYEIHMGQRVIQSFCSEFEAITRYALPEGCLQQCCINIEPLGQIREMVTEETRDRMATFAEEGRDRMERTRTRIEEVQAAGQAPSLSEESLEEMEIELPDRRAARADRMSSQVDQMQGLLRERAEQVTNYGSAERQPPRWRDELRERLERESTSLRMMLDFLERM